MDHTIALIRRAHEGDENARAQLVEENTGLIWCVVKRFYGRGTEAEDLFQIGSIGLLKAIDKFDLGYDVKFSTYAVPMITGEIKRFLRDDGMLKVSRSLKEIAYKAYQAKEALTEKLGREPLLEEIAEETGVEKEELVMAMEAAGEVESLHRPVGMKDGNEVMLLEKIADGLSAMDKNAEIQRDRKGNIIYDKETKDTELVKWEESIEDYMAREVLPHIPDAAAFFEENLGAKKPVIKTGAEIPFTRYFYKYQQPTASEELEAKFSELELSVSERVAKLFE